MATTTTGGVRGVSNVPTTTQTWTYSGSAKLTVGDPSLPAPLPSVPDSCTASLDYLQASLDVAGMPPSSGRFVYRIDTSWQLVATVKIKKG